MAARRPQPLAVERQHGGVDAVGLGQAAQALGEVAHLARIDHGDRKAALGQQIRAGPLVAAAGLEHDQGRLGRAQLGDQAPQAAARMGHAEGPALRQHMNIQAVLRHVDADKPQCF